MVGYNLYSLLFYLLIRLKFDKNYKEGTKMTLPILFSWPMTFFAFILLTISDFLYLKHEIKRLTDTNKTLTIITLLFSLSVSIYVAASIGHIVTKDYSSNTTFFIFGFESITITLTSLFFLFITAKKNILDRKETIHLAQQKYFGHNLIMFFSMVHYVTGLTDLVFIFSLIYLPEFLDYLLPIPNNYPGNVIFLNLQSLFIIISVFVIPFLLLIWVPKYFRKQLSKTKK